MKLMTKKEIKEYLIKKENEGVIAWRKTHLLKGEGNAQRNTDALEHATYLYHYYQKILHDCFGMYRNKWKEKYDAGKFPKCYVPCPPFYDICNRGAGIICLVPESKARAHKDYKKCLACYRKFGFTDSIE